MRTTFVIGWPGHQSDTTATMWLAHEAFRRGHDVVFLDYLDFTLGADGRVYGRARRPRVGSDASREEFAAALRARDVAFERRCLSDEDVVFLRNNPADRFSSWIEKLGNPGVQFGRVLREHGVRLVNDPDGMERGRHVGWLTTRVPDLLPRSIVSRDVEAIEEFLASLDTPAVLKPLSGYGGQGVFRFPRGGRDNLRTTLDLLAHEGYVVAQEWLPAAEQGDKRVLLWDGVPLELGDGDGRYSAYLRAPSAGDHRCNIHAGGTRQPCELSAYELDLCARLAPHLQAEGLRFVGLDLIGDHVLEINVFCPGGLHNMHALYGVDVAALIWERLEGETGERTRTG